MKYEILRGFSLGGGKDVFPGAVTEIPIDQRHMIPAWLSQGKIREAAAADETPQPTQKPARSRHEETVK